MVTSLVWILVAIVLLGLKQLIFDYSLFLIIKFFTWDFGLFNIEVEHEHKDRFTHEWS